MRDGKIDSPAVRLGKESQLNPDNMAALTDPALADIPSISAGPSSLSLNTADAADPMIDLCSEALIRVAEWLVTKRISMTDLCQPRMAPAAVTVASALGLMISSDALTPELEQQIIAIVTRLSECHGWGSADPADPAEIATSTSSSSGLPPPARNCAWAPSGLPASRPHGYANVKVLVATFRVCTSRLSN